MRKKQNWYLFAAALVAGTVGMSSCSNEEMEVTNPFDGKTTKLALGISILQDNGITTKAAAADVNLGGGVANIKNVTVVPMIGEEVQNPISLPEYVSGTATSYYKEATVLQSVNRFRVYGNLLSAPSESSKFTMPGTATELWDETGLTAFSKPHPLYYFADTDPNGYYAVEVDNQWDAVSDWGTLVTGAIGAKNRVKISGVTYAVGTLAAAVLDGIKDVNEQIFFDGTDYASATQKYSWADLLQAGITVAGITIDGQTKEFTETFEKKGTDNVTIYESAATTTLAQNSISFNKNKIDGANIYSVVAPTEEASVTVNFRFKNETGHNLQLNNNEVVANNEYFYIAAPLRKTETNSIFAKGKTTILNATVTDWGKGTKDIVESTDVQIGIEIAVDWAEGAIYNQEI